MCIVSENITIKLKRYTNAFYNSHKISLMKPSFWINLFFYFQLLISNTGFTAQIDDQDPLLDIQARIDSSISRIYQDSNIADASELRQSLELLAEENPSFITAYWAGYINYRLGIVMMQLNREGQAQKLTERAIAILERQEYQNVEYFALLSLVRGLELSYSSTVSAAIGSRKVRSLAEKAMELDNENPRAKLAMATYDYYTPRMFGGGRQVEPLLSSVLINEEVAANPYLPTWGRWDAYRMLIRHYHRNKNYDKALAQISNAIIEYPDDRYFKSFQQVIAQELE